MVDQKFYRSLGPLSLEALIDGLAVDPPPGSLIDEEIFSASGLSGSEAGQVCFIDNKRRKSQLESACATACLTTDKLSEFVIKRHIIPLISKTPRAHFARIVSKLVEERDPSESGMAKISKTARVHKTAVIGADAVIEDDVDIGPYVIIGPGVHIGAGTKIGSHSNICFAIIGQDCAIKSGAVIGGAGFGVATDEIGIVDIPHIGRVLIGDRVRVGSKTCIDRGQLQDTVLGDDVKIDNLVQVAHNVTIGDGTLIAGHVGISGSCVIGKSVQMGGNVGLVDHVTIGDGASIAARAGVMHDIPAGEVWSGIPAMPIRDHMRLITATRKLISKPKKD